VPTGEPGEARWLEACERAAGVLLQGGVVALPTDTVYGLGALARDKEACKRIFELKSRPPETSLPVLVAGLDQAKDLGVVDARFERLSRRWWPGPLTIVTERRASVSLFLGGDESTVGLRHPGEPIVEALARLVGPLAVTSANRHGEPPRTVAEGLAEALSAPPDLVLDGGERNGVVSTVVRVVAGEPIGCVREGAVGFEEVLLVAEEAAVDGRSHGA
jgi:L-threonylcarbamoyladenylate synthase